MARLARQGEATVVHLRSKLGPRPHRAASGQHAAAIWNPYKGDVLLLTALEARKAVKERTMLGWAIAFLVIAIIAAILGFGGVAGTAIAAAKIIFVVAIILFLISGVAGLNGRFRGRRQL